MLTEKDYCDYETCVALKELGYPMTSKEVRYEGNAVFVPGVLLYSAQKWLREEKKIDILIELETKDIRLSSKYYSIHISYMSRFRREFKCVLKNFDSYEEALAAGIKETVKILKENETIQQLADDTIEIISLYLEQTKDKLKQKENTEVCQN